MNKPVKIIVAAALVAFAFSLSTMLGIIVVLIAWLEVTNDF